MDHICEIRNRWQKEREKHAPYGQISSIGKRLNKAGPHERAIARVEQQGRGMKCLAFKSK